MNLRRILTSALALLFAAEADAECGICAEEVTLSNRLAACYLQRLDEELERAERENADIYLVELTACGTRGSLLPQPQAPSSAAATEVDEAFLISVPAMICLAQSLRDASFADKDAVIRVEIRNEC